MGHKQIKKVRVSKEFYELLYLADLVKRIIDTYGIEEAQKKQQFCEFQELIDLSRRAETGDF